MFCHWTKFDDIIMYACSLSQKERTAFLTVLSAIRWSIWKTRNKMTFQDVTVINGRSIILLICGLINYWSGILPEELKKTMKRWIPQAWDEILLQVMGPVLQVTSSS